MNIIENSIQKILSEHKNGKQIGVFSICSANPVVIETSLKFASKNYIPLLFEVTCNQVNQFGGYTGWQPEDFARFVRDINCKYRVEDITLGGDHLGPYPWKDEPAETAMEKARDMVYQFARAGYSKIHLDASMKCADDPDENGLDVSVSARRAAELCKAAEAGHQKSNNPGKITYVIGTEVPLPGGVEADEDQVHVSLVEDVQKTINITRKAFFELGLQDAWGRVVAVVVQPGVEFGDSLIFPYDQFRAKHLTEFIRQERALVFEAHSTDYQVQDALRDLVQDHFAILKVGPELTFLFREAMFSLAMIESELLDGIKGGGSSNLVSVIEDQMIQKPGFWENYYKGTEKQKAFARKFSFSDRIRYYWNSPAVQNAICVMNRNLYDQEIPLPLISQLFPNQYQKILEGKLTHTPRSLIEDRIEECLQKYAQSCGLLDLQFQE